MESTDIWCLWITVSVGIFVTTNRLLRYVVPASAKQSQTQEWKWRNIANSFIHSLITGLWSVFCFWETPAIREDLIAKYTRSGHTAIAFSIGYFIYDTVDMLMNHRKRSSYELMVHHILVIISFCLAVFTRLYIGFSLVALFIEINSVFLHMRQLLLIQNYGKDKVFYRVNSIFNIATFIVFRLTVIGWMTRWLVINREILHKGHFTIAMITLSVVMVMNIVLFLRVLNSDFNQVISKQKKDSRSNIARFMSEEEADNSHISNNIKADSNNIKAE